MRHGPWTTTPSAFLLIRTNSVPGTTSFTGVGKVAAWVPSTPLRLLLTARSTVLRLKTNHIRVSPCLVPGYSDCVDVNVFDYPVLDIDGVDDNAWVWNKIDHCQYNMPKVRHHGCQPARPAHDRLRHRLPSARPARQGWWTHQLTQLHARTGRNETHPQILTLRSVACVGRPQKIMTPCIPLAFGEGPEQCINELARMKNEQQCGTACANRYGVNVVPYRNPATVAFPGQIAIPWDNMTCANSDWTVLTNGTVHRSSVDWTSWTDRTVLADTTCAGGQVLWERRGTLRQAVAGQ